MMRACSAQGPKAACSALPRSRSRRRDSHIVPLARHFYAHPVLPGKCRNVWASEFARRYAAFRGFLGKMLLTFRKFGTILKIQ
jgi:hypothetical protein